MITMTEEKYFESLDKLPLKKVRKLYRTIFKAYNNRLEQKIRNRQWDKAMFIQYGVTYKNVI